jgi:PEGA domain
MLKKVISSFVAVSLFSSVTLAQSAAPTAAGAQQPAPSTAPSTPKPAMQGFGLEDGTPVKLRTSRTISSGDAHVGDTLDFEVLEEVVVDGITVIPKSAIGWGTVTEAEPKRRMGRGGKLNVNIDSVRLADGEKSPLRAVKEGKGGGHTGAMTGAMVATSIVFFPAAPLFLFMHGKDITIPKGTEITAYINGDTRLERAKFVVAASPNATAATASGSTMQVSSTTEVQITSTPPGADIEVDGKFVGSTPSAIGVTPGDHEIAVKKRGFVAWDRKITVSAGKVNINADLTPEHK